MKKPFIKVTFPDGSEYMAPYATSSEEEKEWRNVPAKHRNEKLERELAGSCFSDFDFKQIKPQSEKEMAEMRQDWWEDIPIGKRGIRIEMVE